MRRLNFIVKGGKSTLQIVALDLEQLIKSTWNLLITKISVDTHLNGQLIQGIQFSLTMRNSQCIRVLVMRVDLPCSVGKSIILKR